VARTIVVKVGTSTLSNSEGGIDSLYLQSLADQLCGLMDQGHRVVLVTSGAVRAGVDALKWTAPPRSIALKQAAAAVGQGRLMAMYDAVFGARGKVVGQVLLTRQLAEERIRYVNAQNTLAELLKHGALPIINENDTVSTEELRFGDNDTLAALVAALVQADLLILLTNVDGLLDREGSVIPAVENPATVRALAGGASQHGSGGMLTKLTAAEIAGAAGVRTIIARGRRPNVIPDIVAGNDIGTSFRPASQKLRGRKHWLAYGTQPRGTIVVNVCAVTALVQEHRSLLPAGIVGVEGEFSAGETVSVRNETGVEFARGQVTCSHADAQKVMGAHTSALSTILGRAADLEIIHKDNLVILPSA
jgi:glutamate 5-kinase